MMVAVGLVVVVRVAVVVGFSDDEKGEVADGHRARLGHMVMEAVMLMLLLLLLLHATVTFVITPAMMPVATRRPIPEMMKRLVASTTGHNPKRHRAWT